MVNDFSIIIFCGCCLPARNASHSDVGGEKADVNKIANDLYNELQKKGVEVLFDDRDISAGAKFAESDIIGIPYRVVVSEKSLAAGGVEIKRRSEAENEIIKIEELVERLK